VLKIGMALVALATVRSWGRVVFRRVLLTTTWGLGVGMAGYGALGMIVDGLRAAGVIGVPESTDWTAFRWHLLALGPVVAAGWGPVRRGGPGLPTPVA